LAVPQGGAHRRAAPNGAIGDDGAVSAMPTVEPDRDHVRGGASAPTLVLYGDYECPYTRLAYRGVQHVEGRLGEGMRFVFRHFPLTEIHPHAEAAAEAAEAAGAQGRFWPVHDALFRHGRQLEAEDLRRYVEEAGVDLPRFDAEIESETPAVTVARHVAGGLDAGVLGTPTIFIEGVLHEAGYDADTLEAALRSAGAG
jgi:protein-disulfide isomerase